MNLEDLVYNSILFMVKGNRDFFKILKDFQDKLPPKHKRATKRNDISTYITTLDTTNMKMNLTTQDIDLFHKKLENFNYDRIFFKRKKIISYSKNIQRLLSTSQWEKFGIAMVQTVLEDDTFKKSKPYLFGQRIGKLIGF